MALEQELRERIDGIVQEKSVVLFMKGDRQQPQCGFSATVVGILEGLIPDYKTVDVLSDPAIREGIKSYSEWPTIPQLYIDGEFFGGCDLIQTMYQKGDLQRTLGLEVKEVTIPTIDISQDAVALIKEAVEEHPNLSVHLKIDAKFGHDFSLAPKRGHEVEAKCGEISIFFDRESASRADGLKIDVLKSLEGTGFSIENPNAPPSVNAMEVEELRELMEKDSQEYHLIDVREESEREIAKIAGSRLLNEETVSFLDSLSRDVVLVFQCHSGVRSQSAAEYFRGQGFTKVYNLTGCIDAWSQRIDPSVPRY